MALIYIDVLLTSKPGGQKRIGNYDYAALFGYYLITFKYHTSNAGTYFAGVPTCIFITIYF